MNSTPEPGKHALSPVRLWVAGPDCCGGARTGSIGLPCRTPPRDRSSHRRRRIGVCGAATCLALPVAVRGSRSARRSGTSRRRLRGRRASAAEDCRRVGGSRCVRNPEPPGPGRSHFSGPWRRHLCSHRTLHRRAVLWNRSFHESGSACVRCRRRSGSATPPPDSN